LLVQTFMNAMAREYVHAEHWHNTIVINTGDISPVNFALPMEAKLRLLQWGYEATREYLPRKLATHTGLARHAVPASELA
jgi:NTE family protein